MYENYLWATSRGKWVRKPGRGLPKGVDCVFCGIAMNHPEIPKKLLFKDKHVMVVMNIFPYNLGHLQVVPVRHVIWPEELTEEEFTAFFRMIRKTMLLLKKTLNPKAFNLGMNIGGDLSGGSILHLHAQIVPRYTRDLGFMEVTMGTKVMVETINQTYKKLMKNVNMLKD
jgi:diadenosine tetraphosphate (Ap4A) HIT family hydrolase